MNVVYILLINFMVCILISSTAIADPPLSKTYSDEIKLGRERKTVYLSATEAPPYMSEKLPHGGGISRITTEAYKTEGYTVKYEWLPIRRAVFLARKGVVDGFIAGQKTPEREAVFDFGEPITSEDVVFFHLKSRNFDWNSVADLKGLRIGSIIGAKGYGDAFYQAEKAGVFQVDYTTEFHLSLKKLLAGRIDILVIHKQVGLALIEKIFSAEDRTKLTYHKKPLDSSNYYIMFSRQNGRGQEIIDAFDSGLQKLKKSGKYQQWLDEALGLEGKKTASISDSNTDSDSDTINN